MASPPASSSPATPSPLRAWRAAWRPIPQSSPSGFIAANPELKWADTSRRGYMMIEVTPERVTGEWLFLQTIKARSTNLAGSHRMHVARGRKVFAS